MTFSNLLFVPFRKLTLTAKLLLIGLIPVLFLIYFATIIYTEKTEKVELISNYIDHIDQSATITELISELGRERRYSFFYKLYDTGYTTLFRHRERVDSIFETLKNSKDAALRNFPTYTFLKDLPQVRKAIDSLHITSNEITDFYTQAIFRLNTLSPVYPSHKFLKPVYQDLVAQDKLSEMITYLSIIRTNVFNTLFTGKYMTESLLGTIGIYRIYKSYETEFLQKASPSSVQLYKYNNRFTEYNEMTRYLDSVFSNFKFDSSYTATEWWNVSTSGLTLLREQQRSLWKSVNARMKQIYRHEENSKKELVAFIFIAIVMVLIIVLYLVRHIKKILTEINVAAAIISKGGTGLSLINMPKGIIGNLAESIKQIDKNNLVLANAASQIGKGNFDIKVQPRSNEDVLGISILKMEKDLSNYASQKDKIQKQTEELVYRRDEFFSIASHELKTPVTSLKAYTQLLLMDADDHQDPQYKNMLERMEAQLNKLTSLINDILDSSKLESGHLIFRKEIVPLKNIVVESITHLQPSNGQHELIFNCNTDAKINADPSRIEQVVSNFLTNAIKFASNSSKILIETYQKNCKVFCSVQDFGKGIDPEEQQKIFERFYKINGPNLNTFPGLGLGLFISKEIIEKHGGIIGVKSEKGIGSTFYFELPVEE